MTLSSRRDFLHPASAAAILGSDWLAWLLSSFFELELFAPVLLWAGAFAGVSVWLVEGVVSDPVPAFAKGLLAAGIVWMPGLTLGTVVGLLALVWWLSVRLAERRERTRREP